VALTLQQKQQVVSQVTEVAATAHAAVAAEYRGLSVAAMTQLRTRARDAGVHVQVVRNTLARRALAETDFACMSEHLTGPLVLAFSTDEPGSVARVMGDFAKTNDKLVVRLVSFGGRLLGPEDLETLAKLPTRDEAIAILMSVLNAPITKLVRTMAEPCSRLVRTVAAVTTQKEAA